MSLIYTRGGQTQSNDQEDRRRHASDSKRAGKPSTAEMSKQREQMCGQTKQNGHEATLPYARARAREDVAALHLLQHSGHPLVRVRRRRSGGYGAGHGRRGSR